MTGTNPPGSPKRRLQRAISLMLATSTSLERVAAEEGYEVPMEISRALATIRQWSRQLSDQPPDPGRIPEPRRRPW